VVIALTCAVDPAALGAELTDAASRAYAAYVNKARQSFLDRTGRAPALSVADRAALRQGSITVRPGGGDGILGAPESLIHHWFAAALIPGVSLDQVVSVSRAYRDYPTIFHPIVSATIVSDEGDSMRIVFRMKESAAGMSATLDMASRVAYSRPDARHAYVISNSDEIHEIRTPENPPSSAFRSAGTAATSGALEPSRTSSRKTAASTWRWKRSR
jgi:hypothetical protein